VPIPTREEQDAIDRKQLVIEETQASFDLALEQFARDGTTPVGTEQPVEQFTVEYVALVEVLILKGVFTRREWLEMHADVAEDARARDGKVLFEHEKP
jgi:hypothetical protein